MVLKKSNLYLAGFHAEKVRTMFLNLKTHSISFYTFCTHKLLLLMTFKITGFIRNK